MALVYATNRLRVCDQCARERFPCDFAELLDEFSPSRGGYYRHEDLEIRTTGIEEETAGFPNGHSRLRAGLLFS